MSVSTIPRRSIPGTRGGRPLVRPYWFAPRDGDLYPLESEVIRTVRLAPPVGDIDTAQAGWAWAIGHARLSDQWIVIPLNGATAEDRRNEALSIRSSVVRTASRIGFRLITQKLDEALYVYAIDHE
jgi:hypothetical protein